MVMADVHARERYTKILKCLGCGQAGSVAWEEKSDNNGGQCEIILLSRGFHKGESPTASGDPSIVCNHCDTVLAG
jgi:hypothetical protein